MSSNIIPTDIPVTLDLVKSLSTLDQQAIVRPNNPPAGIAGFLFDIELDSKIELTSDITDNFVENNTAVQDHIALRPETVTFRGIVAELVTPGTLPGPYVPPPNPLPTSLPMTPRRTPGNVSNQINAALGNAVAAATSSAISGGNIGNAVKGSLRSTGSNLLANTKYNLIQAAQASVRTLLIPSNVLALANPGRLPNDAQNAVNVLVTALPTEAKNILQAIKTVATPASQKLLTTSTFQSYTAAGPGASLFTVYSGKQPTPPKQTRQTSAFLYFYNLWKSRSIFSVETPWGTWTNMAIQSIRADQDDETKYKTDFTITFKKIRVAQDVTISVGQLAGRNVAQATEATPSQRGVAPQTPATDQQEQSWLYSASNGP
jgi:hypothetical protein